MGLSDYGESCMRAGNAMTERDVPMDNDWTPYVSWDADWEVGSHLEEYDCYTKEPDTCEVATVWGPNGECLASLGCIDDADDEYRAIVESDLIKEALLELERQYLEANNA